MTKATDSWAVLFVGIPTIVGCVYLLGYAVARCQGTLVRHMIGNAEGQNYWVSGPHSCPWDLDVTTGTGTKPSSLEFIYQPLSKAEGELWTSLLSEEVDLSMIDLPPR